MSATQAEPVGTVREESHDGRSWTTTVREPVTLGATEYRVEEQDHHDGGTTVWLYGPRGAAYILRPYLDRSGDTGVRQVISWTSGAPLRRKGNEIKAVEIAGHIEQYVRPRR